MSRPASSLHVTQEAIRSFLAVSLAGGGTAAIVYVALARSIDDAIRLAGLLGGIIGSVIAFYFTKGIAEQAERRAVHEATQRIAVEHGASRLQQEVQDSVPLTMALLRDARRDSRLLARLLKSAAGNPELLAKIEEARRQTEVDDDEG